MCLSNPQSLNFSHQEINNNITNTLVIDNSICYFIHDNGGTPYVVRNFPENKHIYIYKQLDYTYTYIYSTTQKYEDILPGEDNNEGLTGNSVIIRISDNNYCYIGSEIYMFKIPEGEFITEFYSDIGNSNVPYPYAISQNYVYIMLDKVMGNLSDINMNSNIYNQYYRRDFETYNFS